MCQADGRAWLYRGYCRRAGITEVCGESDRRNSTRHTLSDKQCLPDERRNPERMQLRGFSLCAACRCCCTLSAQQAFHASFCRSRFHRKPFVNPCVSVAARYRSVYGSQGRHYRTDSCACRKSFGNSPRQCHCSGMD